MKTTFTKELPIIAIVLLPFIYLAYIWQDLPAKVPVHWDLEGNVNRYGSRFELLLIPILLPLLIYVIFLVIPKIDPKNKLKNMGSKFGALKIILTLFMSALALFILYSVNRGTFANPNFLVLGIGVLFFIMGDYFKTIRANYFIGIRTPWTLENETVWIKTHKMAGTLWFIGGILIIIFSLILNPENNMTVFLIITAIITIIPIIYSYLEFKKLPQ